MSLQQEQCPVCQSTQAKYLFPAGNGQLVRCSNCSLVYFTPRPTREELSEFYNSATYREDFQHSTMAGEDFAQSRYNQLESVISRYAPSILTKPKKRLLDIGCGTGDLLKVAVKQGWEITGTEISPLAVEKANRVLENKVLAGDIFTLDLPESYYDVITIYHVIEHLLSPIDTLSKIRQLLSPDGIAFIETPNIASLGAKIKGEKWSHIIPPEHITYFQPSSLRYSLKKAEFKKIKVFTSSPQIIESITDWTPPLKGIATLIYRTAPLLDMGAALQAIAFKI